MSSVLTDKINGARRHHVFVSLTTGAASAVLGVGVVLGLALYTDYAFELSRMVRAILLVVYALGAAGVFMWLAVRPVVRGPDDEDIALAVERVEPGFATRLIAAVQFSRMSAVPVGMHEHMIRALIGQAEEMARPVEFASVFPTQRMWQLVAGAGLVVVGVTVGLGVAGPTGMALAQRAVLANVALPRATQVEVLDGDRVVARGDTLTVSAIARGVLPESGTARLRFASGSTQRFAMSKVEADNPGRYEMTLDSVLDPFEFDVYLNDGRSDRSYKVSVVDRPAVASLDIKQVFPAYTRLGTVPKQPADLALLAGSGLLIDLTSTAPVARRPVNGKLSRVTFHRSEPTSDASTQPAGIDGSTDVPLIVDPQDAKKLSTMTPLIAPAGTVGMTLHLVDESGMESRDPAFYRITMIDDKPPVVVIRTPFEREETVTRRAFIPIGFTATDDFALSTLRLHYRVVQKGSESDTAAAGENAVTAVVAENPESVVDLNLGENPAAVRGVYRHQLARLVPQPLEGDLIEWWLEAVDGNDATGPGKVVTDVYRARVVSEIDKRAELLAKFGEAGSTFNDLAETQQTVNEKLGGAIMSKEPAP